MNVVEFTTKNGYPVHIQPEYIEGVMDLTMGETESNTLINMKSGGTYFVIERPEHVLAIWKDEVYEPSTLKEWMEHISYCERMGLECEVPQGISELLDMEV